MKIRHTILGLTCAGSALFGSNPLLIAQGNDIQQIQTKELSVIPRPANFKATKGEKAFILSINSTINASDALKSEAKYLQNLIDQAFEKSDKAPQNAIKLSIDSTLKKEAYKLNIANNQITIIGGDAAGVFYGIQTLRQLLPVKLAFGKVTEKAAAAKIEAASIADKPLTQWRGAMVDSARHFQPKEFIMKFIDLMAMHKMNRLHWHLVDSEGWRLEIKKYPKLHQVCQSFPAEYPSEDPENKTRPARYMYGHFHGGGFYTQEDVKEIVAYAKERHVEIMPEIEFPGHAMAMFTAYPEFSITGKKPSVRSNISPDLIHVNEKSLNFLRDILDETMELFPFEMIHFGGDEAPKGQWKKSPSAQAKMKELGLKDEEQLQAWLFNEMAKHIAKKGRRPAGWEEIMHGENMEHLTKKAVIMPWLSRANGVKSANHGHGVIHTSVGPFYLDSWQTASPADNWALYKGPLTMAGIYNYNLFPKNLTEEGKKNIWGAQCQLWSELMPKPHHMEYQAFPRLTALAELTWTQPAAKNYDNYYKRLLFHTKRLDALNVNYRFVDPLPVANWNAHATQSHMSIELSTEGLADKAEEVVIELRSTNGSPLSVSKVEILSNDKVVSVDEHAGKTDSNGTNNAYTVTLPAQAKAKNAKIKVHYQPQSGSKGEIRIFKGRGKELFNPRNFAGGDYPTASWKKSEISTKKHTVRIPMDGLVKEAGSYELLFKLLQSDEKVTIGQVNISGAEGSIYKSKKHGTMEQEGDLLILPLIVEKKAVKPGNSIFFSLLSSKPSGGEVRVRAITEWPAKSATEWTWYPSTLKGANTAIYINEVKALRDGEITAEFRYTGGANGLDINSVQLVQNGSIITQDAHKGFTGGRPKNNVYKLKNPAIKKGVTYQLRLSANGAGGTDSNGVITIK